MSRDVLLFKAPPDVDLDAGEFIEGGGPDGWAEFQAYRDRALGS